MGFGSASLFALLWIGVLFTVAAWAEAQSVSRGRPRLPRLRHLAYMLALGVYCSSWTIYGAVGSVVRDGWNYLPIYLAPLLMLVLAPMFLRRLAEAVAEEQATTPSDFIAARFGHDVKVARLVTVIALAGSVPYMALQLRSIGNALAIVTGLPVVVPTMVAAAVLLAVFAILFGARRFERAGRSEGMVYAIGLESAIKFVALALVGFLAISMLTQVSQVQLETGLGRLAERFHPSRLSLETWVIALISACAVIVLPRQFYMALVEAQQPSDLPRARWGLAIYLGVMAVLVLPIALAGVIVLGDHVSPDFYVLNLPLVSGHAMIAAAALIGGISAAAAMVIADATALATMVSNDLIFPTLVRADEATELGAGTLGRQMLLVRRTSIVGVIVLALAWALLVSPSQSLASIGLVAFAAMAQFTPHLLLATYGRQRDAKAARASLTAGLMLWLYTLALPPILPVEIRSWLASGPLDPLRLFGIGHAGPLVHGVVWSLGVNLAVYAAVAARKVQSNPLPSLLGWQKQVSDMSDLKELAASFIGHERAEREFPTARSGLMIDRHSAQRARKLIASVVGTSSARALVASALAGGQMSLADVTRLLDERGQSLSFSRQLLAATFENIEAGISVVDSDQRLVAWNSRYEQLFDYPAGLLYVGAPVADLIRYNARRGDFGANADDTQVEFEVEKRLAHLRRAQEYTFERYRPDGQVIKMVGGPMPGGGYVTSFIDITAEAQVRAELERTLATMEVRIAERTRELSDANRQLAQADRDKTRFLAAASHDLLQPLHAARLFSAALAREVPERSQMLVGRVDNAIIAAETLLRALLDISKFDAGGVTARPEPLLLGPFLADLVDGMRPMAEAKGLSLRVGPLGDSRDRQPRLVHSDPGLLRSLLQNFLANALRYTVEGGVILGVRWRRSKSGDELRIDVIDTGVGIAPDKQDAIFGEFTRLGEVEAEGLGLGLALSRRIARLLGARIEVASRVGRGSRFSLYLPALHEGEVMPLALPVSAAVPNPSGVMRPLNLLVLDNDPLTVEATSALLTAMGHHPFGAEDGDAARAILRKESIDAVLADYRLDTEEDGLSVVSTLRKRRKGLPALLITAETSPEIRDRAVALGVAMQAKPASAAGIEAFLAGVEA